ncbi:MAG: hypothetical protein AABO57_11955 [Acidobacteriota bacterium]
MKQVTSKTKISSEILSTALSRSLENLGIDIVRFQTLALGERKLALCEAIYRTAGHARTEIDWYADRSELYMKELWDFSPAQIDQHQTMVDALIALVCLGEVSYVRPLVAYLSFPEPRWSILICPVLEATSKKFIRTPTYSIPSASELSAWRKWAVKLAEPPILKDYGDILLSEFDIGKMKLEWSSELSDFSWLLMRNEFFVTPWKYFNESEAKYCALRLYEPLKSGDWTDFADTLEQYVYAERPASNFKTIVACINDIMRELNLSRTRLKEEWLSIVSKGTIRPFTALVLFQILERPGKDRQLAYEFAEQLLGKGTSTSTISTMVNLLLQSRSGHSVYRIIKTFAELDKEPARIRDILSDLYPMASHLASLWITNLFATEMEYLIILGSEQPKSRSTLLGIVAKKFTDNDKDLLKLSEFQHSENPDCRLFSYKMKILSDLREPLQRHLHDRDINTLSMVSEYKDIFYSWFVRYDPLEASSSAKLGALLLKEKNERNI